MRVLVTGASGFLGRYLMGFLRMQGHDIWALLHDEDLSGFPKVRRLRGSVTDLSVCERAVVESRADTVFHLAAQAIVPHARLDPFNTLEANVRGSYNMLEAFRRHRPDGSVMLVASSDKAYGNAGIGRVYHENSPMRGRGPYDVSKSCADLLAQSYAREFGLSIGIARAGNIYGPGDTDMTRIVPSVASDLAARQAPTLTSDGTPVRDYLYVTDAVDAYALFAYQLHHGLGGGTALNFSGGQPVSALELATLAIDVSGIPGPMEPRVLGTRVGEIQHQVLNSDLARKVLKWTPRVDLRTGLIETIDWWRGRRE